MTWKYRYRKQILVVSLFILLIASSISLYVVKFDKQKEKDSKKDREIVLTEKKEVKEKNKAKTTNTKIMVDIKGEVVNPGIYTLDDNQRVIDVINMAGGITKNADTSVLNLSKKPFFFFVLSFSFIFMNSFPQSSFFLFFVFPSLLLILFRRYTASTIIPVTKKIPTIPIPIIERDLSILSVLSLRKKFKIA